MHTFRLEQRNQELYTLIPSNMDEDDPYKYCQGLHQVDAQQFPIKRRIVDLDEELKYLEVNCCIRQFS